MHGGNGAHFIKEWGGWYYMMAYTTAGEPTKQPSAGNKCRMNTDNKCPTCLHEGKYVQSMQSCFVTLWDMCVESTYMVLNKLQLGVLL